MALPVVHLRLNASTVAAMEKNVWSDRFATAHMLTESGQDPIRVRYRGGHTRNYPKRSYEVVRNGRIWHYNAEYDDPSMIRNALSFAFFPWLGVSAPRTQHVLLYRNGERLGVYLEIEGVDRSFFRRRNIGATALFYASSSKADFELNAPGTDKPKRTLLAGYEHRFGGLEGKELLTGFIAGLHRGTGRQLASFIRSRLDTDAYLRWLAGAVLTGNFDGFEQNYAIYRHRNSGKWRVLPWDYEGTWGRNCYGRLVEAGLVSVTGYNALTRKLWEHRPFRRAYAGILKEALDGPFTELRLMPLVDRMLGNVSAEIRKDAARRYSASEFSGEASVIRRYIRERRAIVAREAERL
ncbi:CotH kinase family protein [Cohnella faecalis]|uniref:Spore coat protein CotH n=1 Tax=Cohnella faecalis TaxID=2315694 RepID=A0A398CBM1_9BACL|nr:CotH kinase family protein [Cohnella faecalis]RIE00556.1 spore coat protein CotH [Cohnella faecalis]